MEQIDVQVTDSVLSAIIPQEKNSGILNKLFDWRKTDNPTSGVNITLSIPNIQQLHLYGTSSTTLASNLNLELVSLSGASKLDVDQRESDHLQIDMRGYTKLVADTITSHNLAIHQSEVVYFFCSQTQ